VIVPFEPLKQRWSGSQSAKKQRQRLLFSAWGYPSAEDLEGTSNTSSDVARPSFMQGNCARTLLLL